MKKYLISALCFLFTICLNNFNAKAQTNNALTMPNLGVGFTDSQLFDPAVLVKTANPNQVILNIGVVEDIKGAVNIGPLNNAENIKRVKIALAKTHKSQELIIYCGCCPFSKCPNIKLALPALNKLGYNNVRVLNLPTNLKTDWIDKGYPLKTK